MNTLLQRGLRFWPVIMLCISNSVALAGSLAETATNPIGNLIQVQIQDQYNFNNHNSDGYSNAFIVQPVVPINLPFESVPLLITRTTFTYVTTPDVGPPVDRRDGLGDTVSLALALPKLKTKGVMVGLGAALSMDTASDDYTGNGAWSGGPSFVYFNGQTKGWQWGVLGWHLWDFAGENDRPDVNKTFFQPFVVKHFGEGLYVATPDVPGTYNWEDTTGDGWTFPLGVRLGKVMKIGAQPVNLFAEVFNSPWDDGASSEWSLKLSFTLLFPKGK